MPVRITDEGCGMAAAKQEYDMISKRVMTCTGLATLLAFSVSTQAGGLGGLGGGLGGGFGGGLGGTLNGFGGRGLSGTGSFASQGQLSGATGSLDPKPLAKGAKDKVDTAKDKAADAKNAAGNVAGTAAGKAEGAVGSTANAAGNLDATASKSASTAPAASQPAKSANPSGAIAATGSLDAQHGSGSSTLNGTVGASSN